MIKPSNSDGTKPVPASTAGSKKSQKLPKKPRGKVSSGSPKIVRTMGVRKVRARRVRRTIRHVDPWSVFKIALPLCACIYFALVIAFSVLLRAVEQAGLIEKIEDFATSTLQFETFEIQIETIQQSIIVIGLVMAVVTAAAMVLGAVLFNLISDIMGGIRVSVIEEEPAVRVKQRSRAPRAKKPAKKTTRKAAPPQNAPVPPQGVNQPGSVFEDPSRASVPSPPPRPAGDV